MRRVFAFFSLVPIDFFLNAYCSKRNCTLKILLQEVVCSNNRMHNDMKSLIKLMIPFIYEMDEGKTLFDSIVVYVRWKKKQITTKQPYRSKSVLSITNISELDVIKSVIKGDHTHHWTVFVLVLAFALSFSLSLSFHSSSPCFSSDFCAPDYHSYERKWCYH